MKYCINCGAQINNEQAYCSRCGAPLNYAGKPEKAKKAAQNAADSPENGAAAPSVEDSKPETSVDIDSRNDMPAPDTTAYANDNYSALPINNTVKNARGLAIFSLITGIIGFLFCCFLPLKYFIGIIILMTCLGAISFISGILALKKRLGKSEKTIAVIGVVLGGLGLFGGIFTIFLIITGLFDVIGNFINSFL